MSNTWKWDVDIYDRPGWNSFTYNFPPWGGIRKGPGDEILIRFDSADATAINDDFYFEHHRQVVLRSRDGGRSWEPAEPDWSYCMPLALSDGTLVEVVEDRRTLTRAQQRARLVELGIGGVWREDCMLAWDLWPASMAEELRGRVQVWDRAHGAGAGERYLPEGVVATHRPSALLARRSTDRGATWQQRTAMSTDSFSHFGGGFPGSVVLADDTILVPFYALRDRPARAGFTLDAAEIFVLRSGDRGQSYEPIRVGGGVPGLHLSETCLVALASGRVVALIRGAEIHQSISGDGGRTWSTPRTTGMKGMPLHALALDSGSILCAYAHRQFPGGIRATLSPDGGETWLLEQEKILRDDAPASDYIGGPGSVQLADGTIFTFYSLVKEAPPGEVGRPHCYIAGSRYTEDYVRPLGR